MVKKSVIESHKEVVLRAPAGAGRHWAERGCRALAPGAGVGVLAGKGGAYTGDCETGGVSVSLTGSGDRG